MFHLNSQGQKGLDVSIACSILGIAAVIARLICKYLQNNRFHIDDVWIIFALTAALGANAIATWGSITGGGGKEMKEILMSGSKDTMSQLANYLEGLLLAWTFYLVAAFGLKLSLLFLYRRLFPTSGYRQISLAIIFISIAWLIGAQIGNFIICIPFDSFWHRLKPGRCLNFNLYALIIGITEIVIDSAILALPVRIVLSLHLPTHKKVGLMGIFLLGGFVIVTGIIRVKLMYQPHSIYVRFSDALIWSNVHLVTATICACLPIYKPLTKIISTLSSKFLSFYHSHKSSTLPSFVRRPNHAGSKEKAKGGLSVPHISLKGIPIGSIGTLRVGAKSEKHDLDSTVSAVAEEGDFRAV